MKRVAIVGVGLIGSSFGLALRQNGFTGEIIGVSSAPAIEAGVAAGAIDGGASLAEAAAADLIYLAQPVDRILATLEMLTDVAQPGTLVTDAGSTKRAIVRKADSCLTAAVFLGGHPMAGKETRGAAAAEGDLFRGRPYVLTPTRTSTDMVEEFRHWLLRIGARLVEMTPEAHDATVAHSSHLPQIASTALALTLSRRPELAVDKVFGTGLLDMTRLALSSKDLWAPILETNKEEIMASIDEYVSSLESLRDSLRDDNLVELFEIGSGWAKLLREPEPKI